jgi:hypothetical protein
MSTPVIGRTAVIKKGTTEIGFCKSVSVSIDADLIKQYFIGGTNPDRPAFVASGNKSFKVSIEKAFIDNAYATDVLNGAAVTIEVSPQGTGAGKPKITLSNVIFNSWKLSVEQDGIIMESVEGEGQSIEFETQT